MTFASSRSQNPGDLLHLPERLSGLVYESRALSDREANAALRISSLTHYDFIALAISANDESLDAGFAQGWPVERGAVFDIDTHQLHPF